MNKSNAGETFNMQRGLRRTRLNFSSSAALAHTRDKPARCAPATTRDYPARTGAAVAPRTPRRLLIPAIRSFRRWRHICSSLFAAALKADTIHPCVPPARRAVCSPARYPVRPTNGRVPPPPLAGGRTEQKPWIALSAHAVVREIVRYLPPDAFYAQTPTSFRPIRLHRLLILPRSICTPRAHTSSSPGAD